MKPTSHFDAVAWNEAYETRSAGKFAVFIRSTEVAMDTCRPLMSAGERWLDLGCGTGQLFRSLSERGLPIVGVDHDVEMLRIAGSGIAAAVDALPFRSASIDGAVSVSLAGCLADAASFYAELHRILRVGGRVVITYTNTQSILLRINYAFAKPDGSHFVRYRARDVRREIERFGFEVERVSFYNCMLHWGPLIFPPMTAAHALERMQIERLARNFVVVAKKRT